MRGITISFVIGLGILATLVAADRPHWFGLAPKANAAVGTRTVAAAKADATWLTWRSEAPRR